MFQYHSIRPASGRTHATASGNRVHFSQLPDYCIFQRTDTQKDKFFYKINKKQAQEVKKGSGALWEKKGMSMQFANTIPVKLTEEDAIVGEPVKV